MSISPPTHVISSRGAAVGPLASAVAKVHDAAGLDELQDLLLGVGVVADAHVHPPPGRRRVVVGNLYFLTTRMVF